MLLLVRTKPLVLSLTHKMINLNSGEGAYQSPSCAVKDDRMASADEGGRKVLLLERRLVLHMPNFCDGKC